MINPVSAMGSRCRRAGCDRRPYLGVFVLTLLIIVAARRLSPSLFALSVSASLRQDPQCSSAGNCAESRESCSTEFPELAALVGLSGERIVQLTSNFTFLSKRRLTTNLATVSYVITARVRGDFVETGVARGGSAASLFLAAASSGDPRGLHLFDTFGEFPAADPAVDSSKALSRLTPDIQAERVIQHSRGAVESYLSSVGVSSSLTVYHCGDILETPPTELPCSIALLRLDTDWYSSVAWGLTHLFPRLSPGGVAIVDDYDDWPGARKAVDEFIARPENAKVGFRRTQPPMLCKPLSDGTRAPCGLEEFSKVVREARLPSVNKPAW